MGSNEIRKKFREFFEKKHGHAWVPSSSLIPDDPSVLLTTAGMQQFKPYYTGKADSMKDFGSKNTASIQKCFRTSDIDEVGDESHLTFFEMLGNFSFGGYFKEEAIKYGHEFIASKDWMNLEIDKVTVFDPAKVSGDDWRKGVPFDKESYEIWKKILPESKIEREGIDNFWGPTGSEGPCGPTTEIYVKNKGGQSIEIWNVVFNEFYCSPDKKLKKSKIPGVDTGMGLERLAMVSQNVPTIFETDLFEPIMTIVPAEDKKIKRVIVDHIRGAANLIADGVEPSNKDRGYILRRLLRRSIFHIVRVANEPERLKLDINNTARDLSERVAELLKPIVDGIVKISPYLNEKHMVIIDSIMKREIGASIDLLRSTSELNRAIEKFKNNRDKVFHADEAFKIFSSHGIPPDFIRDKAREAGLGFEWNSFEDERQKHQEVSRAGQEKKFGGHGLILNTGELKAGNEEELNKVLRLHTATHLLQRALREVLGNEVHQMGSDITPERTRFDFSFPRKMTDEEKKKVEELVNQKIKEDLPMQFVELPKAEAEKVGALYFFKEKYPEKVKVYYVGKDLKSAWSKEFCGGPHVTHTGIIGKFRIAKDEAVGAGTRRVRGVVE